MPTVMTAADVTRKKQIDSLPDSIIDQARPLRDAVRAHEAAVAAREALDAQDPNYVNPTSMERLGYAIRFAIYPANFLAELTAGSATARYTAQTMLGMTKNLWLASLALAFLALAIEMWIAHKREDSRGFGKEPAAGWTAVATTVVLVLVGLQGISQVVSTLVPAAVGQAARAWTDLEWYEWARIGCLCTLLGILHAAVLFGGSSQENALIYRWFRIRRIGASVPVWLHARDERETMDAFSRLVTRLYTLRTAHEARGLDPGPLPTFDAVTRAMLTRMQQEEVPAGAPDHAAPQPQAQATPTGAPADEPQTQAAPAATPTGNGLRDENEYLRVVLDARMRNDDGEVQPPAR